MNDTKDKAPTTQQTADKDKRNVTLEVTAIRTSIHGMTYYKGAEPKATEAEAKKVTDKGEAKIVK